MRTAERCAIGVVAALAAVVAYRAWTQSITIDEARNYNLFIAQPMPHMFASFDAANHVLQTLLSKVSIRLFGLAEFTLRLPSVLGALLYLTSACRLSRYLFGRGWLLPLSVLALGLNPFLLDYLTAARGYSLGVGLLMWAFTELMLFFGDRDEGRLFKAGIGLGLSVSAALIFLFPAAALAILVLGILALDGRRFWVGVEKFAGPGLVTAFVVLVLPLSHAKRGDFFYGAQTINEFVASLVHSSYYHNPRIWLVGRYVPGFGNWYEAIRFAILPGVLLAALVVGGMAARRWARSRRFAEIGKNDLALLLLGGAMALMLIMVVTARHLLGVLYPLGRTGIYWVPMMTLAVLGLIGRRYVGIPALAFAAISVVMFAGGFTTRYFTEWAGERNTKDVIRTIGAQRGGREVHLGTSWALEASCNFYQQRFRLEWLKPVEATGADGDFDYYYLLQQDEALLAKRRLRTIFRDPLTGTVLAEKP
ncbi:MAG: ArnT family glycosyltransferase [Bryobacteraceae bacterium]